MNRIAMTCITLLAACAAQAHAQAQTQAHAQAQVATAPASGRSPTGQLVYPARGQAAAQIDRDRFECHEWARQQSGFDPSQPAPAAVPAGTAPAAPAGTGGVATAGLLKGAAGGAAVAERLAAPADAAAAGAGAAAGGSGTAGHAAADRPRPGARHLRARFRGVHGGAGVRGQVRPAGRSRSFGPSASVELMTHGLAFRSGLHALDRGGSASWTLRHP
jgi:hypothetical protein